MLTCRDHLAALIFYLHEYHRMILRIHLAQVRHQSRVGAGIRRARLLAIERKRRDLKVMELGIANLVLPGHHLRTAKTLDIAFDPRGRIVALRIFVRAKPQHAQAQPALAGKLEHHVHLAKVKLALCGLQKLPGNRGEHGIHTERPRAIESIRKSAAPTRGGVMALARKQRIGPAVHHQAFPAASTGVQLRNLRHGNSILPFCFNPLRPSRVESTGRATRAYLSSMRAAPPMGDGLKDGKRGEIDRTDASIAR